MSGDQVSDDAWEVSRRINNILSKNEGLCLSMPFIIARALKAAEQKGMERAAKIADGMGCEDFGGSDFVCFEIAKAIRKEADHG